MTTGIAKPPINSRTKLPMHPNSLANLKPPYKKGENGHGRVYPMKERLQHALLKPLRAPDLDAPAGEHIVYATIQGALQREPAPFHEVWDRTEGKIAEPKLKELAETRIINIFVGTERAKELVDKLADRLLTGGINAQPENH